MLYPAGDRELALFLPPYVWFTTNIVHSTECGDLPNCRSYKEGLVLVKLESVLSSVMVSAPRPNPFGALADFRISVFETPKFGM